MQAVPAGRRACGTECGSLLLAKRTAPALGEVEMEVIAVRLVGLWSKYS